MADFSKALREHVQEETPEELCSGEAQGFEPGGVAVVLVSESDGASLGVQSAQPGVADGHPVSVAAQIIQDVVGSDDRTLGKDDPALSLELAQQLRERSGAAQSLE